MNGRFRDSDPRKVVEDQFAILEASVQTKLDQLNVLNQEYNVALDDLLNAAFPAVLKKLIEEYGVKQANEQKVGDLELTRENKEVIIQIIDEYIETLPQSSAILDHWDIQDCLLRNSDLFKPDQLFLREQFCFRYTLHQLNIINSRSTEQTTKSAIDILAQANNYISLYVPEIYSVIRTMKFGTQKSQATIFYHIHSALSQFVDKIPNQSIQLKNQANELLAQIQDAEKWITIYYASNPGYVNVLDKKQMDLLIRITFSTLKLIHNPNDQNIKEYQALRRQTAQFPRLRIIASSMAILLGVIIEGLIILPKMALFISGKIDNVKPNIVLRKSVTFFQRSLLARQMDRVASHRVSQPSLPLIEMKS